ncbi:amino acid adenylation domain-containing protein, partial [Xanthomonas campestris pv. campestris]|nr:amino acid adenylation domain-containing protein [Xanthomonas campestris pv. campestris]
MNLADVRSLLKERNVNLSVHDDQLVVRAPPGAVDGELLDLLKRYKAELLAAPSYPDDGEDAPDGFPLSGLGSEDIAAVTATTSGGAANLQDIYRLVPLQEGMLFHHMVATDSDPYAQRMVFVFSDRRHLDAFLSALNHVISRHDILRTAIRWEGLAHPVQVVHREAPLVVESLPPGEVGTAMERVLSASDPRRKRLDLQQAPMLLAMLAAEPQGGDLVLALMHHHIGCDHVTQSLIIKEVMAILLGHADGLPRPRQFRESVIKALATTESEHRDYFVSQLGALSEPSAPFGVLDVRTDGADVVEQRTALEPALATQVRSAACEAGVTPATLLHAAWGLVVARLSGQAQVAFGTVLSGRFHDAHSQQPVAGVLINTLPLCTAPGDLSVVDYVAETHRRLMGLLAHEHAPLALALRCSGLPASLPLFTTLLNYRQAASEHADAGHEDAGMALEGIQLIHGEERSNYPITLLVDDHGQRGLTLTAQCVEGVDAGLVLACLVTAIEGLALALRGSPTLRADAVSILPAAQRDHLVHGFNATQAEYPREGLIGACFTAQAQARPGAVAVVEGDERLSYAELECAANQLAHRLVGMGAGPGQRVALCMERGIALVVSMLAVVKAGGAYVPLEPTAPAARLAWQLEDCAPVALLTQDALVDDLPAQSLLPVVVVDDPQEVRQTAAQPSHAPVVDGLGARDLAYVIYTSGSTGQPKGVMVEHRNVLRLVINSGFAPLGVDDCVAHCASPAFDAATWEIWGALLNGARLQIVSGTQVRDPAQLGTVLQAGGVTALWLTAGLFNEVVDALEEALGGLRYLLIGGEALDAVAVGRLVNRPVRPQQVLNGYGPTESTTFATTYLIPPVAPGQRSIPIGRPIGNTRIHVLDTAGQVVPVGVVGELHIGGDGVARGYLNRPELTAERFIVDPFSADPQARLYRTGDLARWRADGTLDYVGRNDFQVKLRGFRVELGEIETQLLACADVREAVVLAREDSPGDKRLVAYVLAEEGTAPEAATLRAALARKLPEYMVPVAFVRVPAWPLTVNGKLDRRALPSPDGESVAAQAYEAPANEREAQVAGLWAELLGVAQVGRHDHFFELGGHSLLAIQLVSALRRTLGREVPLGRLFEHPTLAGFAATLDDSTHSTLGSVLPADRSAALPLSWAQQRLWFLDQLDPAAGLAYHIPAALRLQGALDVAALQATLDRIVARHESLRTRFVQGEDGPVQQFAPETIGFALEQVDLSALPDDAQQAMVEQRSAQEALAPFDLAVGPLIRGQLLRLSAQEHVLLVTQHHIVSDGWSIGVMIGEVTALYAAFSEGQPDPLPPLAIQYADYALWQRQWLQGEALQQQLEFWREHLSGAPALLELPTDRPRPAVQSYAGGNVAFTLPAPLVERLHALSHRHGTTLFMTLLGGWALLMSRLSGQGEVVIGTPVANRQRAEIEPLIGFFVNTLALRVNVPAASDVAGLLAQVKATALAGYAHQDVPFEQVVEALQPERSMGHTPVIQVMLALNNTPDAGGSPLSGLELSALETPRTTTHFDLSLSMTETPNGLECGLEYASDLFDAITVQRWAKHLAVLLDALADHEEMPLAERSLLSAPERHQLLHEFNATRGAYPANGLIGDCFSTQAQAQPDAVALSEGTAHMTYAELERRANQLAHRLIGMGVRPDDRVALCMERSIDLVVSMLAVLKAGGAYVPLEPSAPAARLAWQLDDCAPVVLLSHRGLHRDLAVPRLYVDEPAQISITAAESMHAPHIAGLVSRHLAYVIYTSGSTGQPKGVMVEHRSVLRLVINSDYAPLGSDDCVAHCASPAFDAATWEIWGPLLNGARVQVITSAEMRDPAAFSAVLSSGGVTAMMLTTGLFNQLVDELEPVLGGLRHLLTGGEAMDPVIAGRLVNRRVRPQRVLNVYGPTEATAYATAYEIVSVEPEQRSIPIGRPISNTRVYVLDTAGQLVPPGVAGELHIGGDGVARGYLNRPELTAERFIADPFDGDPDAHLYRTGDLVRWRTDGTLEYVGRNDFQVKIRGFRIELGEIEARLGACIGVREAVVLAREEAPGVKRLVAYVLAEEGVVVSVAELRQRLAHALPEYMVPSAYVLVAAWPLNVNGKLDRRALPAPGDDAVVAEAYTAPANDLEARVARIWTALLGVSRVGRHDDFFVLGGHSLLAIQLVSALRRDLGIEAELGALFRHSTLSGYCTALAGSAGSTLGELLPVERTGALPLSWAQQRLWFLDQLDPAASLAYHMPTALRLEGPLDGAALQATLDRIVARHESLRTYFVQTVDGPVQRFAPDTVGFALTQADLSGLTVDMQQVMVEQRSAQEARAPFDLARGPLIRGQLLRLSANEHVLLVTQHHIVSDGWSIGVMIGEVSRLYAAFSQGQPDPLAPLPIQYADYAMWQRQWLQGETLQQQIRFWREHLGGAPALLELPTDHPRPAVQSYAGGSIAFDLPASLVNGLRALSQQHGTTLFMTVLAAWATLLSRLSGQDEVVVGTPVANRQRAEVEPLIGFFVNTLALRVNVQAASDVAGLLAQVKATALSAYAHQDLPFEQVVEALQPTRSLGHGPVFQVLLTLNNTPEAEAEDLPGLTLSSLPAPHTTTQFDLSLSLGAMGDALTCTLEYASDLFEAATAQRWTEHLTTLLEAMVAEPQLPLVQMPLLTASQREQLLLGFNATDACFADAGSVAARFSAQAQARPEAVAVVHGTGVLRFGELERRSNQLAHHLLALGVAPDDRVAVCLERGIDLVVALLGVLKAGAAYVPLDPAAPAARVAWQLEDAAPRVVLTRQALATGLPMPCLALDDPDQQRALSQQPAQLPQVPALQPRHLAYVIYTSGSTGQPKGVMVEHRQLEHYLQWAQRAYAGETRIDALVSSPFAFDATITSL